MILDSRGMQRVDDAITPATARRLLRNFNENNEWLKKMESDSKFREAVFLIEKANGVPTILGELYRKRCKNTLLHRETMEHQKKSKRKLESIIALKGMDVKIENEKINRDIAQKRSATNA